MNYLLVVILCCTRKTWCTYGILHVCLVEELLQQPGPEFVEHFFQVDIGASVIVPQIRVQVGEDLGILGV